MKFFIDTANVDEIREAASLGILDGVTTNPSLVAKEGRDFHQVLREICSIVNGPISAEVTAMDRDGMLEQGLELAKIHPNITIKVPLTKDGLQACKALREKNIKVNVTLCFSPSQALMAAKAGASFISPFVGRLDDISHEGMDLIQQIRIIYDNYGFDTEILAASIRSPMHVVDCAMAGADVATIPYKVVMQLIKHPLTDIGLEKFMADWKKMKS
ncbi:MAG: fructose-6-phosphate aldolase [Acidobacteria bacterium]|uniref:Probable transaldolase n=1 Tax=Candidatus Polarisedimenticola svalbardensis TaxID=2886004 RepID=A0A8J6Y8S8_9BACT|nr:fructose-6-phosphate aldolase [Candidatus Polarisedimenticola svalbardensis]